MALGLFAIQYSHVTVPTSFPLVFNSLPFTLPMPMGLSVTSLSVRPQVIDPVIAPSVNTAIHTS